MWTISPSLPFKTWPSSRSNRRHRPLGEPALFTDRSSGPVTGWAWSFGDGGTSSEQNPSHAFSSDGTYEVTLTAVYADGELHRTHWVNVGDAGDVFGDGFESGDTDNWTFTVP